MTLIEDEKMAACCDLLLPRILSAEIQVEEAK